MIYAIVGPTASGKTSLAIKLANVLDCPIINADAHSEIQTGRPVLFVQFLMVPKLLSGQ